MKDIETLSALFDNKVLAVLAVLVNDSTDGLYLREISKFSKVSDATTYRIINKLNKAELLDVIKIKNLKMYKLKKDSRTSFLFRLLKKDIQMTNLFIDKVKENMSLDQAILYGDESNQRANILLIGDVINPDKVKEIVAEFNIEHNFIITHTILTNEQYENMSNTGLFSGKKRILFKR